MATFAELTKLANCTSADSVQEINDKVGNYIHETGIWKNQYAEYTNYEIEVIKEFLQQCTEISPDLFCYCTNLKEITLPPSIKIIRSGAFSSCENLKIVIFDNSLEEIGSNAFYKCFSLTSVYIPNSVKKIANNAFANCANLNTVVYSKNTIVDDNAFKGCNKLKNKIIRE